MLRAPETVLRAPGFLHELNVLCGYQAQYVCMSSVGVHQDIEHVLLFRFRVTFISYLIILLTELIRQHLEALRPQ